MKEYINKLHKEAIRKIDCGEIDDALQITRNIQKIDISYYGSHLSSGLLIDIGTISGQQKIVEEGIELLKKDFDAILQDKKLASSAHYNLGNALMSLFYFKKISAPYFKTTELDETKKCYRNALKYNIQASSVISQVLTNLGNCLNTLGRTVDALEYYDEAIKSYPTQAMAFGNKGIALIFYSNLVGKHKGTFLKEAYDDIKKALNLGVLPESKDRFEKELKKIESRFRDKQILNTPTPYPGYKIEGESEFERFLIEFCIKEKLYLNPCNFCQKCDVAIGDTIVIKEMIVPIKNSSSEKDHYLRLSAYLNKIKQDYITARFLLILSKFEEINLNFVDKRVTLIDTLDYSMDNIYIGLVESSFRSLYNILDKIAYFINDYLTLNIPEKKINFNKFWFNINTKIVRDEILKTNNCSLNALFDINKDFENGPYKDLQEIRHALTHRFVNVQMFQISEGKTSITEDTIVKKTLELMRLVRNAIIYLISFVDTEESKKKKQYGEKILPTMYAQEIPDNLKSSRKNNQ